MAVAWLLLETSTNSLSPSLFSVVDKRVVRISGSARSAISSLPEKVFICPQLAMLLKTLRPHRFFYLASGLTICMHTFLASSVIYIFECGIAAYILYLLNPKTFSVETSPETE